MSDHPSASSAAPPAARSAAGPAPPQAPAQPSSPAAATAPAPSIVPHITCFACSRCEYPICDSSDLLLHKVRQGPSDYAFPYMLDGLLELEDKAVPCYSAAEVVHTSVVVSEALMKVPLPPAARVVALESIVQSRKFWVQQRSSMHARLHEHGVASTPASTGASATVETASTTGSAPGSAAPASAHASVPPTPIVRRYGDSAESRIDLVCVRDAVLERGVQECTQDRSAAATTLASSPTTTSETDAENGGSMRSAPTVIRDPSFAHVPTDVLKAATAAATKTQWSSPGNMTLREAYMEVNRSTLSAHAPWFQDYRCVGRVQCPDCHQALGFIFRMTEPAKAATAITIATAAAAAADGSPPTQGLKRRATTHDRDGDDETPAIVTAATGHVSAERESRSGVSSPADGGAADERLGAVSESCPEADGARLPHAKKTKNEHDAQAAAAATTRRNVQEAMQLPQRLGSSSAAGGRGGAGGGASGHDEGHSSSSNSSNSESVEETPVSGEADGEVDAPLRFVGLELKHVVQREWDLAAFQNRYRKSRDLATFRELFPEAEELQSLYSRLLGLRTQTELYNSLLRRHKEQNDVQMALLTSNKDRMHTYDEKIKTMQQIIEAQRAQIDMQTRQIRNQEELVQSHRRQFATQQRQMDVEQLLLSQQSKTIDSQKEQLRLLKMHFREFQPDVLEELPASTSLPQPSPSSFFPSAGGAVGKSATQATPHHRPREDNPDEEWADVDEEGEEEREGARRPLHRRDASPSGSSGCRGTPPAHLCGVPTSFPASRGAKFGPSDGPSRSPSPPP